MEKFDVEAYLAWCKKNHADAKDSCSLELFKAELEESAKKSEKAEKVEKQKRIVDAIAEYLGRKVKYDGKYFDDIECHLNALCYALAMCVAHDANDANVAKIREEFGLVKGGREHD